MTCPAPHGSYDFGMGNKLGVEEAFVLHALGADRRRTASYYTPGPLVHCLIEEALRELLSRLPEDGERLLDLKICEPAMGCGAFLEEAIDQLSHRSLAYKQRQQGRLFELAEYQRELRWAKRHLATHGVYGVDLNPVAVEWSCQSLQNRFDAKLPSLALRLQTGNSLLGARRAVWSSEQLMAGKHVGPHGEVPRILAPGWPRGSEEIYHFLVFDEGMVPVGQDRHAPSCCPEACRRATVWRETQVRRPWTSVECREAVALSAFVDRHWRRHHQERMAVLKAEMGQSLEPGAIDPTAERHATIPADCETACDLATQSSFVRLKMLMDAWCAFWFWPLDRVEELPWRGDWLTAVHRLLEGDPVEAMSVPWLAGTAKLAAEERFHHWELAFPEVLGPQAEHKGFDLIVGNPPWWKVFQESDVHDVRQARRWQAITAMLKSRCLNPELVGIQTNLYKHFIVRSWQLLGEAGIGGLLHQENAFDDPMGGPFREAYYRRLLGHYQFKNERRLFADIGHPETFSLNLFRSQPGEPRFVCLANLFTPETIAACRARCEPTEPVPGIRTENGDWETRGHRSRLITVTCKELAVFCRLLEDKATPVLQTRLPQVHDQEILSVLGVLAQAKQRLADRPEAYKATVMFDEAYAQRDGRVVRQDNPSFQPSSPAEWIVSGPHFAVGTPLAKTARLHCTEKNHYDVIDLTEIPADYLPLAVYRPGNRETFEAAIPQWPKSEGEPLTNRYRHAHRRRGNVGVERTLISCILPPGCTHIDAVYTIAFADLHSLLTYSAASYSILFDFLVRLTGKTDFRADVAGMLPLVEGPWNMPLIHRALRLNCLTSHYTDLWKAMAGGAIRDEKWTSNDPRLSWEHELPWHNLDPSQWEWKTPLRSDFSRRQALLEIDVLAALALGVSLEQLLMIYRVQFPVMRSYERIDEYDAIGRHMPNTRRRQPGAQELLRVRRCCDGHRRLDVSWPTDGGRQWVTKAFVPPFDRVDREADYARAYQTFRKRYGASST